MRSARVFQEGLRRLTALWPALFFFFSFSSCTSSPESAVFDLKIDARQVEGDAHYFVVWLQVREAPIENGRRYDWASADGPDRPVALSVFDARANGFDPTAKTLDLRLNIAELEGYTLVQVAACADQPDCKNLTPTGDPNDWPSCTCQELVGHGVGKATAKGSVLLPINMVTVPHKACDADGDLFLECKHDHEYAKTGLPICCAHLIKADLEKVLNDCHDDQSYCEGQSERCDTTKAHPFAMPQVRAFRALAEGGSLLARHRMNCEDSLDNTCEDGYDQRCDCDAVNTGGTDGGGDALCDDPPYECEGDDCPCEGDDCPCVGDECEPECTLEERSAPEICDGIDNNCNGLIDEGFPALGLPCTVGVGLCQRTGTFVCNVLGDGVVCSALPGEPAEEICDGLDNNCNGEIDEGVENCCDDGEVQLCGSDVGACAPGSRSCVGRIWGPCVGAILPTEEICDGLDNDCNGLIDDLGRSEECFEGLGACRRGGRKQCVDGAWFCNAQPDEPSQEICDGVDNNCNGVVDEGLTQGCGSDVGICAMGVRHCSGGAWGACEGERGPMAEICDGLDNNCDGRVDEGCDCRDGQTRPCGSSVGECELGEQTCVNGAWGECVGGKGPSDEACDGLDNNCNGQADEGCNCRNGATMACGSSVGECEQGSQTCVNGAWGACVGGRSPSEEICDGKDNNCNGQADEGCDCIDGNSRECGSNTGECRTGMQTCAQGRWGSCEGGRGASPEVCDGKDNNCDGQIDEGCDCVHEETRPCGNGVGECRQGTQTCAYGQWSACEGGRGPQAESCNNKDDDCDGIIDNNIAPRSCGSDTGECQKGTETCAAGRWGDCVGGVVASEEICDGKDNNCNGQIDEGCDCVDGESRACGSGVGECREGTQTCSDGVWGHCAGQTGPQPEVCDGKDNDCNGTVDDAPGGCGCINGQMESCGSDTGECLKGTRSCEGGHWGLCQGGRGSSPEVCDGLDNDCDGVVDNLEAGECVCLLGQTIPCVFWEGPICYQGEMKCRETSWGICEKISGAQSIQCNGAGTEDAGVPRFDASAGGGG